ncbi:hypothetical protein IAQ61_001880 [Plenodomus lingam]|uniref:uncharacterized protein n=1 Tax=Leptosphaeria maculans TaxID=5022 RepID=UPI00332D9342|nr:hypothetical protein IAQ61_001880 [Plenodomus lingam]
MGRWITSRRWLWLCCGVCTRGLVGRMDRMEYYLCIQLSANESPQETQRVIVSVSSEEGSETGASGRGLPVGLAMVRYIALVLVRLERTTRQRPEDREDTFVSLATQI